MRRASRHQTPCEAANAPPGLLLGYANLTESQIDAGVAALARAAV